MEVNQVSFKPLAPADAAVKPSASTEVMQAATAAVRALNRSDLLGEDRELLFARDSETQQFVIRIVSRTSGDVLTQIPQETVLRILADLQIRGKGGNAA